MDDGAKSLLEVNPTQQVHDVPLGEPVTLIADPYDVDEDAGEAFFYFRSGDDEAWAPLHAGQKFLRSNLNQEVFEISYTPPVYGEYRFKVVVRDQSGLEAEVEWPLVQVHGAPDLPIVELLPEEPVEGEKVGVTIPFHDANGDLKRYDVQFFGVPKGSDPEKVLIFSEQHTLPGAAPRAIYDHDFHHEFTDDGSFDHYEILAQAWDLKEQASEKVSFKIYPKPLSPPDLSEEESANFLMHKYPDLFEKDTALFDQKVEFATNKNTPHSFTTQSPSHIETAHKNTYIRIAFPIVGEGFKKSWDELKENLLSQKQNPLTIDEITASLEDWLEEKLSEEDVVFEGDSHFQGGHSATLLEDEEIAWDGCIHPRNEIHEERVAHEVTSATRQNSALHSDDSWAGAVVEYGLDDEDQTPLFSRNDFVDEATGATFKQLNLFAGEAVAEEDFEDDTELSVHFDAASGVIFFAHSLVDEKILVEADHKRLLVAPDTTWGRLASSLNIFKDDLKEFVNIYQEVLVASISSGVGFVPFVGDVKDIHDAIRGEDTLTGEKLSLFERALAGSLGITCLAANTCTEGTAGTGIRAVVQGLKSAQKAYEIQKALHSEAEILRSAERIKRFEEIREKGRLGEIAAGIPQGVPKSPIKIPGTLRRRYPDSVTDDILIEVKNVKYQGLSGQIKDYIKFARQENIPLHLFIRKDTKLSGPLIQAIKDNDIQIEYLPL